MNKGLHVFCEKPLGVDIKECLMVEEEAKKYGTENKKSIKPKKNQISKTSSS